MEPLRAADRPWEINALTWKGRRGKGGAWRRWKVDGVRWMREENGMAGREEDRRNLARMKKLLKWLRISGTTQQHTMWVVAAEVRGYGSNVIDELENLKICCFSHEKLVMPQKTLSSFKKLIILLFFMRKEESVKCSCNSWQPKLGPAQGRAAVQIIWAAVSNTQNTSELKKLLHLHLPWDTSCL